MNRYAYGWAHDGNTPSRRWKKETFRGGTTDPFVVSWPEKYPGNGELRHQYGHAIDMVPVPLLVQPQIYNRSHTITADPPRPLEAVGVSTEGETEKKHRDIEVFSTPSEAPSQQPPSAGSSST